MTTRVYVTVGIPSGEEEEEEEEKVQLLVPPVKSAAVKVHLIKPSPCNEISSITYYNKEKAVQPFRNSVSLHLRALVKWLKLYKWTASVAIRS